MLSVIEATLEDPRQVLFAQQFRARGEAVAAMKAEGIEYEERMELLEEVTWPKPLAELLEAAYDIYAEGHPWVTEYPLRPKSVARDLYELAMTFVEYVGYHRLASSEGLVLRYLADAYKALRRTVPEEARTEELADLTEWLGRAGAPGRLEPARRVGAAAAPRGSGRARPRPGDVSTPARRRSRPTRGPSGCWCATPCSGGWSSRRCAAGTTSGELDADSGWDAAALGRRRWSDYYAEHDDVGTGPRRAWAAAAADRGAAGRLGVRQVFDDPAGDHDWGISAEVDLAASDEEGAAVVRVLEVGTF